MSTLHVIDHPMIQHKLTIMRDKETPSSVFRQLLYEISLMMGYEVTRDFPLQDVEVETPLEVATLKKIAGKKVAIVPILRAGLGMVDGLRELIPVARVGFIGLYRDETTHQPVPYYCKLPKGMEQRMCILTDPMLATGGSACDAIDLVKKTGCKDIRLMCLVAAPEGVRKVQETHPDVDIYVAAVDRELNSNCYILPGLGDAGDRIFGTI
ncbi:MAG: uracil phosphoribosyltransferase [Bacteroidales bacterium]|nr:uracil phosphoribosyltransferase [Bacteroidales bacterium]